MIAYLNGANGLGFILLLGIYLYKYKGSDSHHYSPTASWIRAFLYFSFCFGLSALTGTQAFILSSPLWTEAQLTNQSWLLWTTGITGFILFAYWFIWVRYTIRFDRKIHLLSQIPFGLIWGLAMGQVIMMVWHLSLTVGADWPLWGQIIFAWSLLGFIQWAWQDLYWDIYISPEHDSPYSIPLKTFASHIPNVTLCLIYMGLYQSYMVVIALQTLALIGCTIGMRMPPFWSTEQTPAARRIRFFGPIYRAGGYVSSDPKNDRYLKAAHLPR
ncbi:hypothetical protein QGN29_03880 [Temperatibacter marinus]|uniref:Uncharacterized protein n=1 Tax=Temperatibacter marinus TaxID=1456591 RepID=A0AA52EEV4_9PROT|nr:hypothetical protein [Temperatibacter marinus]WND03511.1 hypothetical protein QGN29_03880 [Temperatibacter marinus]